MGTITKIFKPRRGLKSTMTGTKASTVLSSGEIFIECQGSTVGKGKAKIKIGDGTSAYSSLDYAVGDTSTDPIAFSANTSSSASSALSSVSSGATLQTIVAGLKQAASLNASAISKLNDDSNVVNNSISNNVSSISTLSGKVSSNSSSISNLSNSITSLGNRITTLESNSNNPVLSISTGDICIIDSLTSNSFTYNGYTFKFDDQINYPMEVYISASSNKIFLFGVDPVNYHENGKSGNTTNTLFYDMVKYCSWTAKFTFNGKSYTEAASLPSSDQLYKYTNTRNRMREYPRMTSDGFSPAYQNVNYYTTCRLHKADTSYSFYAYPAIEFSL